MQMNKLIRKITLILILLLVSNYAYTHSFAPSLLEITETSTSKYNVVWKASAQAASNIPITIDLPNDCVIESQSTPVYEGTGIVSNLVLDCTKIERGLIGQLIKFNGLSDNQTSVLVMLKLQDNVFLQATIDSNLPEYVVPEKPTTIEIVYQYSWLGIDHILGGTDHLLFVFGLLLLVGGGYPLLWTITAFTIGHSITLIVTVLSSLTYPVALIELTIAISIFMLALQLIQKVKSSGKKSAFFAKYPWFLAGGFGLLHGFGFAGALSEIGLPQNDIPLALLFFNIGIELGQLLFIGLIIVAWLIIKPIARGNEEKLLYVPIYVLGTLSVAWCIERGLLVLS